MVYGKAYRISDNISSKNMSEADMYQGQGPRTSIGLHQFHWNMLHPKTSKVHLQQEQYNSSFYTFPGMVNVQWGATSWASNIALKRDDVA